MSNSRRRHVIRTLADGETDIGTLSEVIAADENDTTPAELDSQQRKRVYISLYQVHLEELVDCGIIEYDRHEVRRGPAYRTARDAVASVASIVDGAGDRPLAANLREVRA